MLTVSTGRKFGAPVDARPRPAAARRAKKTPQDISGRTENNRVVNFAGEGSLIGQFVQVEITEVLPNSLRGKLVTSANEKGFAYAN